MDAFGLGSAFVLKLPKLAGKLCGVSAFGLSGAALGFRGFKGAEAQAPGLSHGLLRGVSGLGLRVWGLGFGVMVYITGFGTSSPNPSSLKLQS